MHERGRGGFQAGAVASGMLWSPAFVPDFFLGFGVVVFFLESKVFEGIKKAWSSFGADL